MKLHRQLDQVVLYINNYTGLLGLIYGIRLGKHALCVTAYGC